MKTMMLTAATLMLLTASPALAMTCCGGAKGKAGMCAKGGAMAMNHSGMKAKKGGCCCDKMGGKMSHRA